jgi:hypothetical protein
MTSAQFVTRDVCINCGSSNLHEIGSGLFNEGALHGFPSNDAWGENPVPYLEGLRWTHVKCGVCQQAFHARVLSPEWNEINFSRWMSAEAIAEFERTHGGNARLFERAVHYTKHILQLVSLIKARPLRVIASIQSMHDYECIHPLQHINGFTPATLRSIAERLEFEPIRKPVSHVTTSALRAAKTEARRMLDFALRPTTQQYFRLRSR